MRRYAKTILAILFFISFTTHSCAQQPANSSTISKELLKSDYTVFRDSLEQLHAGLYRYKSKAQIDKLFDSGYAELDRSMPLTGFYLLLKNIVSNIQDGHTSCNMPAELANHFVSNAKVFPVQLYFINEKAFVPCKTTQDAFRPGTEILYIDNRSIREIRQRLFSYMASDGSNETKKYADLNNAAFAPLYYLVYGEKSLFAVRYKNPSGQTGSTEIAATLLKDINCRIDPDKNSKYLSFGYKNDQIAVMMIRSFSSHVLSNYNDYAEFLETSFKEIKQKAIKTLIIDLRDNGGGHDVFGSMLYSYLTDKPFPYYSGLESTKRKFDEKDHPNLSIQQPAKNNFKGRVYFLINGGSFSTTAEFCAIAKSNGRGVFIGEETGGGYYGNTSGASARINLPSTRLVITIPKTRYTMAVKEMQFKDRGIIPDFIIVPGIDDIIKNRDIQLRYALKLAGG